MSERCKYDSVDDSNPVQLPPPTFLVLARNLSDDLKSYGNSKLFLLPKKKKCSRVLSRSQLAKNILRQLYKFLCQLTYIKVRYLKSLTLEFPDLGKPKQLHHWPCDLLIRLSLDT